MDFKVIKPFIDSQTDIGYNEGSAFETEDSERATFLIDAGHLKAPVNEVKLPETVEKSDDELQDTAEKDAFDLKTKAKALKIKGYTKMTDEELKVAIEKAELQKVSD